MLHIFTLNRAVQETSSANDMETAKVVKHTHPPTHTHTHTHPHTHLLHTPAHSALFAGHFLSSCFSLFFFLIFQFFKALRGNRAQVSTPCHPTVENVSNLQQEISEFAIISFFLLFFSRAIAMERKTGSPSEVVLKTGQNKTNKTKERQAKALILIV